MPEYEVLWHDCGDDRSGTPFKVKGDTLTEAYLRARDTIKGYSPYLAEHFVDIDIECLVDEDGHYHSPDSFLKQRKVEK